MFGNPRDILSFKSKNSLQIRDNSLHLDNKKCNLCDLIGECHRCNSIEQSQSESETLITESEQEISEQSQSESETLITESDESEQKKSDLYYTDGLELDICMDCINIYPKDG